MITTGEALEVLKGRGIDVSYSNLALWVRSGKFQGAKLEDAPRGSVWLIPLSSVERFEPPKRGRRAAKKSSKR